MHAGDGGPNLALNLWYNEWSANPLRQRQGAFHELYEMAYNRFLVPHFDDTVAPPIPPSNYDQQAEGADWETQQDGEDDGEQEWNERGFDSLDDNALALYLRERDGVSLVFPENLDEVHDDVGDRMRDPVGGEAADEEDEEERDGDGDDESDVSDN